MSTIIYLISINKIPNILLFMKIISEPKQVLLFIAAIYNKSADISDCTNRMSNRFGGILYSSEPYNFNQYTDYYNNEMGDELSRCFIFFKDLIDREEIVNIKLKTMQLENFYSIDSKRTINLDPGYIAQEHVILSTHKGYSHRPYLSKGVYADLTLIYKNKYFESLEWTYPDFKSDEIKEYRTRDGIPQNYN